MQAYLIGKAEDDQQYPVRYPEGRIREEHRDPNTGEERYALLIGNLYGMPTARAIVAAERAGRRRRVGAKDFVGATSVRSVIEYNPLKV